MIAKPIVLISDIHFCIRDLELASSALEQALRCARDWNTALVIAGDLNDSKDIIRGRVMNRLLDLQNKYFDVAVHVLVGNHDLVHEKSNEHGLNFLEGKWAVHGNTSERYVCKDFALIPYQSTNEAFLARIKEVPKRTIVIAHQGFMGASMGEYVVDKSSVDPELVKDWRIISGHYHRHQTIGSVTYIGSPYTISFAEANDGPKGFQLLWPNGELQQVETNLRTHRIFKFTVDEIRQSLSEKRESYIAGKTDLVWIKLHGPALEVDRIRKRDIGERLIGHQNFKLDRTYTEVTREEQVKTQTDSEVLDRLIETNVTSQDDRDTLKLLWRELCS